MGLKEDFLPFCPRFFSLCHPIFRVETLYFRAETPHFRVETLHFRVETPLFSGSFSVFFHSKGRTHPYFTPLYTPKMGYQRAFFDPNEGLFGANADLFFVILVAFCHFSVTFRPP